jgi:tetratricopeptide (TPR) repeat protein
VAYFEVLSRDPQNKFAFFNLGQIARVAGKNSIAEGYYRSSLEIDPRFSPAANGLGLVRLQAASYAEAASLERIVIAAEPNNATAHYNLALALRGLGQNPEASAEFATAQRLDAKLVPPTPVPTTPATPSPTAR